MRKEYFKETKIRIFIIVILSILSINIFITQEKFNLVYKYNSEQIETIFYIHENIPENSKILVPNIADRNYLYDLLIRYEYQRYDCNRKYLYNYLRGILKDSNYNHVVVDLSMMEPSQLDLLKDDNCFILLFENDLNIVFKYHP